MDARPMLTLCGTYTLDPVARVVDYWIDFLGLPVGIALAPYAQLFQQMLDPASEFRRNRNGTNVVCVRWEDLLPRRAGAAREPDWSAIESCVTELASALASFEHAVPCLVLVGPGGADGEAAGDPCAALAARLVQVPYVSVEDGAQAMRRYRVGQVADPASDRFGHVPYTPEALAALGTTVARWHAAMQRRPVKVIAVDGDHTLWGGVVAENGVQGVRMDPPYLALQGALAAQNDAGRLICLLSKNDERDVRDLFAAHPQMPLRWSHLVAQRVDWNPKPGNLREIVAGLELGLDSVVFLDDNPVECAQMRAQCPATMTVRVPTEPERLAAFADHLWLFDQPQVTEEDRKRAAMYRENASRAELRRDSQTLQSFLDGLELVVEIEPPSADEVARLAQLTQRTNQFNASLIRHQGGDVCPEGADALHRAVRARDRFGDYGIVGQIRARARAGCLEVDLFMLSCRALGRGIEHRMLAAVGAHAQACGLERIAVLYRKGDRNLPVRRFLESVFATEADDDSMWFAMPAAEAAKVSLDTSAQGWDERDDAPAPVAEGERAGPPAADPGALYERIAHDMTTAAAIEQAISARIAPRPDIAVGFIAPAPGMERDIAAIWRQVLRMETVGAHDRFQELGGKSIHLVQVHKLLLERLHVDVDITTLFQHPTVASLAAHLSMRADGRKTLDAAQQRGARMREARARAAKNAGVRA